MVLGITGLYCSGKSHITKELMLCGFCCLETDKISHSILNENKELIIRHFGVGILKENKDIDRKKLGDIVFRNKDELKWLESLLHPLVIAKVKETLSLDTDKNYIIESALIFENELHLLCDKILIVNTNFLVRFKRALNRDKLGLISTLNRFLTQVKLKNNYKFYKNNGKVFFIKSFSDINNIINLY